MDRVMRLGCALGWSLALWSSLSQAGWLPISAEELAMQSEPSATLRLDVSQGARSSVQRQGTP